MKLNTLDPRWDNQVIDHDHEKYNWRQYFIDAVQEKYPQVKELEKLHEVMAPNEINDFVWDIQRICKTEEFAKKLDDFMDDVARPRLDGADFMVQDVVGVRVVIPNQAKHGRTLNFHQGIWYGHGPGMFSIWSPITEAWDSNTMQILPWEESRMITQRAYDEQLSYQDIQKLCLEHSIPCNASPGQTWLFQQGHIHGNINNETDITRWSFDTRVLVKGGNYGRRRPGGYFRLHREYRQPLTGIDTNKNWINYIDMNSRFCETTPFFVTSMIMSQFCKDMEIEPVDYPLELSFCHWEPMLEDFIKDPNIHGIIIPSILGMTYDKNRRDELINLAFANDTDLLFVDERILLNNKQEKEYLDKIFEYINDEEDPDLLLGHTR